MIKFSYNRKRVRRNPYIRNNFVESLLSWQSIIQWNLSYDSLPHWNLWILWEKKFNLAADHCRIESINISQQWKYSKKRSMSNDGTEIAKISQS